MIPSLISCVNQSSRLADSDVSLMVSAVSAQLSTQFGPAWGYYPGVTFQAGATGPVSGAAPCYFVDEPDVPNALGYHAVDYDGSVTGFVGIPYIKVFVSPILDNGGTPCSGSMSVSACFSHEALEFAGDTPANRWVDGPTGGASVAGGVDYAFEVSDAVEGNSYPIGVVTVSNFVLPPFFDPNPAMSGAKFDFMGVLGGPFTMAAGGYMIVRTEPGTVSQTFADSFIHHLSGKVHLIFGTGTTATQRAGTTAKYKATKRRQ